MNDRAVTWPELMHIAEDALRFHLETKGDGTLDFLRRVYERAHNERAASLSAERGDAVCGKCGNHTWFRCPDENCPVGPHLNENCQCVWCRKTRRSAEAITDYLKDRPMGGERGERPVAAQVKPEGLPNVGSATSGDCSPRVSPPDAPVQGSKTHILKTWPEYFAAIESGAKTFEVRKGDRDFNVGDVLDLVEYDPDPAIRNGLDLTGRNVFREVTYVMRGGNFGLMDGWVIMGIKPYVIAPSPITEQPRHLPPIPYLKRESPSEQAQDEADRCGGNATEQPGHPLSPQARELAEAWQATSPTKRMGAHLIRTADALDEISRKFKHEFAATESAIREMREAKERANKAERDLAAAKHGWQEALDTVVTVAAERDRANERASKLQQQVEDLRKAGEFFLRACSPYLGKSNIFNTAAEQFATALSPISPDTADDGPNGSRPWEHCDAICRRNQKCMTGNCGTAEGTK